MSAQDLHLLIVDDDERIRVLLQKFLIRNGFLVSAARDAGHARRILSGLDFDLIVLDVMMPGEDGISLTRDLREDSATPILLLTAKGETEDRIAGLEAGADDYMVKPFSFEELAARLRVQERRAAATRPAPARLSAADKSLRAGSRHVHLTDREFSLLALLAAHAGTPLPRGTIFDALWAGESSSENVVDVYIGYLRKKLKPASEFGFEIVTVRHQGFCLEGAAPLR